MFSRTLCTDIPSPRLLGRGYRDQIYAQVIVMNVPRNFVLITSKRHFLVSIVPKSVKFFSLKKTHASNGEGVNVFSLIGIFPVDW